MEDFPHATTFAKVIEIRIDNSVMMIFWADGALNKTNKFGNIERQLT